MSVCLMAGPGFHGHQLVLPNGRKIFGVGSTIRYRFETLVGPGYNELVVRMTEHFQPASAQNG